MRVGKTLKVRVAGGVFEVPRPQVALLRETPHSLRHGETFFLLFSVMASEAYENTHDTKKHCVIVRPGA